MSASHRNHRSLVSSALASALALGLAPVQQAQAHQGKPGQEACYGVAKAGENQCGNLSGTHTCAGEATADHAIDEWKYVPKGSCKRLKGFTKAEAEARMQRLAAAPAPQRGVRPASPRPPGASSAASPASPASR